MNLRRALWPLQDARLARRMALAQRGDRAAFRDLYQALYPRVARFVAFRVVARADVEDIVSQVFFRLLESLSAYEPSRGGVLTYTLSIARNAVADSLRRVRAAPLAEADSMADLGPGPLERLASAEASSQLRKRLTALSSEDQHLVLLRFGDGLRYREIAQLLGMKPATIRQRVSRAVRSLREPMPARAQEGALVP